MTRIAIIALIFISAAAGKLSGQVPEFCLTRDEYRLYSLINEYRAKKGLGVIPVSRSLCYVAKIHVRDLYINNPDTALCSLNSWSDKGKWTSCCHSKLNPNPVCIVNKPRELAGYPGEGHELAYWDSESLNPDTVLHFWQSIDQAREVLLNQKKWSNFNWKAIGVGLYKGYACIWVGEVPDTLAEPALCSNTDSADNFAAPFKELPKAEVTAPTGRYYIIFGSFNSKADALKMMEKYQKDGFSQAKILLKDTTFRVSLSDYLTQQEALTARNKLGDAFKDAWVTKY